MEKAKTKKKAEKKGNEMLSKEEWLKRFFGKVKSFGDGLEYQKMIRHGER
jgi:hypothetical protein